METLKAQEIKVIISNKGRIIGLKVDYINKEITILDQVDTKPDAWQPKKFEFANGRLNKENRTQDIAFWHDTLDTIRYAIEEGEMLLQKYEEKETNEG
jgi:hypothetical protein